MFMQPEIVMEEEFSRPVESIMRCEDFKSNFARKLSNRYIPRSPISKQDHCLKLHRIKAELPDKASERIELCTQLSKSVVGQNGEPAKLQEKQVSSHPDMRSTEVNALNMEVETLRWQLSQTESNRQMHIALLKQVVSFLNRVKEHIECQKPEIGDLQSKETSGRFTPRSFNLADLPRSRSVVHVNKNTEYSLTPPKKATRKISKSISNVNGYKDCNIVWNQSKLFLPSEMESQQKITEEMSRLITLANTVLSTKLPDLVCTNDIPVYNSVQEMNVQNIESTNSLNSSDENTNAFILNTTCEDTFINGNNKDTPIQDLIYNTSPTSVLEKDFANIKMDQDSTKAIEMSVKSQKLVEKRNDYNHTSNFIEDESGFSSMSSFQEIGIPIISIIPPSPCKEMGYMDDITDILEDNTKWRSDAMHVDKQAVKVFWV